MCYYNNATLKPKLKVITTLNKLDTCQFCLIHFFWGFKYNF